MIIEILLEFSNLIGGVLEVSVPCSLHKKWEHFDLIVKDYAGKNVLRLHIFDNCLKTEELKKRDILDILSKITDIIKGELEINSPCLLHNDSTHYDVVIKNFYGKVFMRVHMFNK